MSDDKEALVTSDNPLPAVLRDELPRLVDAGTLVEGLRYLQQRIPDYTQLTAAEARSLMRVAYLDPEFVENGLQAAAVWESTKLYTGRSAEELRREAEECRRWDEVERELAVVLKGIAAANLKRKHRLGSALWLIYNILRRVTLTGADRNLRPYFDAMKRAYLKRRKKPATAAAETQP
jgi:hypothetical protein